MNGENTVQNLIDLDDANDDNCRRKCQLLAKNIQTEQKSILELVEELGPLLTHTLPYKRELGLTIFNNVLEALPDVLLSESQLDFITKFYSDRLKDHSQIIPVALKGILVLARYKNLPKGSATVMLKSLFLNVHCQQQKQPDRYNIYCILKIFLDTKTSELQMINYDFILGVITAVDGERDPYNLLFLFDWLPQFFQSLTMGHLVEEAFESMACYFPVDFKSPAMHPNRISRENLADSLCRCLCALPEFGQFAIPLAVEKLDSSLQIAKMDSLKLLTEGCKTFSEEDYLKYFNEIWTLIYKNLLNCTDKDEEFETANLEALTAIINKLSLCEKEEFSKIVKDVFSSVKGNLMPEAKLYKITTKILIHLMKASKKSADFVLKNTMPVLINLFNISTSLEYKVLLLETIVSFTRVYMEVHDLKNNCNNQPEDVIEIPKLCLQTLLVEDDQLKSIALKGLVEALYVLNDPMRKCLYKHLCELIVTPQTDIVRAQALSCLKNFAQHHSTEIQQNVIDQICIKNLQSLELYLQALLVITPNQAFTNFVVSTLIKNCLDETIERAEIGFKCLKKLLVENEQNFALIMDQQIVNKLISWFFKNNHLINANKEHVYEDISVIILILIGHLSEHQQKVVLTQELNRVVDYYNTTKNFSVLFILSGLLLRSRKEVGLENMSVLLEIIEYITIRTENKQMLNVGAQLLANLLNKLDEDLLNQYLISTKTRYENFLNNDNSVRKENVFINMAWITKSLLARGHNLSNDWTVLLVDLLETYDIAETFKIIMCNSNSLSAKNYCTVKLLYQQKLFCNIIKLFNDKFKNEPRYLKAIGFLLEEVPKSVFFLHFSQISRFVILCLDNCEEFSILISLLGNLSDVILKEESIAEEYVDELLPRLCKLSAFKPSMRVRIMALRCLQNYTQNCPLYKLLPHKQNVIQQLTKTLDDPKRLVRKEAMNIRLRWYLLDAPM